MVDIVVPTVYLANLKAAIPGDDDIIEQGDDELRIIKKSIQASFPGIVTGEQPITWNPAEMNDMNTRIGVNYEAGGPNNYLEFTTKINIPYLPSVPTFTPDLDYLTIAQDGSLDRTTTFAPLGSVFISPLAEADMNQMYPTIYIICDGRALPETSELFKFLQLVPGSGYKVPDLISNDGRTIRASNATNLHALDEIQGKTFLPPSVSLMTFSNFHDHVEGIVANQHTHKLNLNYNSTSVRSSPGGEEETASIRRFNTPEYYGWNTSGAINNDGTPWTLPGFTHNHNNVVTWNNPYTLPTRSKEIRANYFIRIN